MRVKVGSRQITLDTRIGGGGEGDVYTSGKEDIAYKIYKPARQTKEKQQKIQAMVDARLYQKTKVVAFPIDIVFDLKGKFLGFSMALAKLGKPIHELYSPKSRREEFPTADYRFLIRTAGNMARAIGAIHAVNCVIGDINHSGILVSPDATVTLIDADSFQFTNNSKTYPCEVGVPDFTPPELQGRDLGSITRKLEHDHFGLAIGIFQLLMMRHPYTGIYPKGIERIAHAIKSNIFCYSKKRASQTKASPARGSLTLDDLPTHISYAFEDAFGLKPSQRPDAKVWIQLLDEYEKNLSRCHQSKTHFYSSSLNKCCWCRLEGETSVDFFPEILIGMAGGYKSTHIDIRKIIQACKTIKLPDFLRAFPKTTTSGLKPSSLVIQAQSNKGSQKWFGMFIIAGAIAAVIALPGIWLLSVIAGYWGFTMLDANIDTTPIQNAFNQAEKNLGSVWNSTLKSLGIHESYLVIEDLQELISNYSVLDIQERDEILNIQRNKAKYQLQDYLSKRYIKNFKISGIGPAKTVELSSWGIETAADVETKKILQVPGFGPKTTDILVTWRRSLEKNFKPQTSNAAELAVINQTKAKYDQLRSDYEKKISSTYQSVSRAIQNASIIENKISSNSALKSAAKEYSQAWADMEAVGLSGHPFDPMASIKSQIPGSNQSSTKSSSPAFHRTSKTTTAPKKATKTSSSSIPSCPNCGSSMVKRLAQRGRNAGNYFWGCSRYPRCKGTKSI